MKELSAVALVLIIIAGVLAAVAAAGAAVGAILAIRKQKKPGSDGGKLLATLKRASLSAFVVATFLAAFGVAMQFKAQVSPLLLITLAAAFAACAAIICVALVKSVKAGKE